MYLNLKKNSKSVKKKFKMVISFMQQFLDVAPCCTQFLSFFPEQQRQSASCLPLINFFCNILREAKRGVGSITRRCSGKEPGHERAAEVEPSPREVLPCMGYIGMCCSKGYDFSAVLS